MDRQADDGQNATLIGGLLGQEFLAMGVGSKFKDPVRQIFTMTYEQSRSNRGHPSTPLLSHWINKHVTMVVDGGPDGDPRPSWPTALSAKCGKRQTSQKTGCKSLVLRLLRLLFRFKWTIYFRVRPDLPACSWLCCCSSMQSLSPYVRVASSTHLLTYLQQPLKWPESRRIIRVPPSRVSVPHILGGIRQRDTAICGVYSGCQYAKIFIFKIFIISYFVHRVSLYRHENQQK